MAYGGSYCVAEYEAVAIYTCVNKFNECVDGMAMAFVVAAVVLTIVGGQIGYSVLGFLVIRCPPRTTLLPYPTHFRSSGGTTKSICDGEFWSRVGGDRTQDNDRNLACRLLLDIN